MKKIVLVGAAGLLTIGFFTLTAFGGKTKAQQEAEIATAVTAKVEEFRAAKAKECDDRIAAESQSRYATMAAATPEPEPAPAPGKKPAKKGTKGGPKVDPLPQPTPPAKTDNTNRGRGDATNTATPGENKKRGDAVNTQVPGENRKRGDAVKKEGGN